MDRLVRVDVKEIELCFKKGQRCSFRFRVENLMHTMSVAIKLTTPASPSRFSIKPNLTIITPLSSLSITIFSEPLDQPHLVFPLENLYIRTSMLPTGKAEEEELNHLFSKPGSHIFKDATLPICFTGEQVFKFLFSSSFPFSSEQTLLSKSLSSCTHQEKINLVHPAVISGKTHFVLALIDAGADVNSRDSSGILPITAAVVSNHVEITRILLNSGSTIDQCLLHTVAESSNGLEMLPFLLNSGKFDVDSVDSVGRSVVHVAALHGHLEILRLCVANGGDPELVDVNGWTPLHCAASDGHLGSVEFLLECSKTKFAVTHDGKTPFMLAMDGGHQSLYDVLHLGDALQRAAACGNITGMKSYIAQGVAVNGRDQHGWTPLHRAAFKGRIESVKFLINHGAQIDPVDDLGYTPLHCAVEAGHTQIAIYLIGQGARINSKSLKGVCPQQLACFMNHPAVLPLLQDKERA